jgi:hypothetical protein
MNEQLVSDIVRRALAPEPVSQDGTPREETPIQERLRLLNNALGSTNNRVAEQQAKLAALKKEIDDYRLLVERMKDRAVEGERLAKLVAPAAAPVSAAAAPDFPVPLQIRLDPVETVPAFEVQPAQTPLAYVPAVPHPWLRFAPYAAVAGLALLLHVGSALRERQAVPSLRVVEPPPPAAETAAVEPAAEEVSDQVVLALVHDFVPPGGSRSLAEILGEELESPATDSPWTITRVDETTTLVSFRPYGEVLESGPVYEFAVNAKTGAVQASPETLANLRGGDVAAIQ